MKFCQMGLLTIIFASLPVVAAGQSAEKPSAVGRYSLTASSDGLYFLDTSTGALWFKSSEGDGGWNRVSSPVNQPQPDHPYSSPTEIPEGFRIVTVRVANSLAQLDAIRPRDMVDVYVTYEVTDADGNQTMNTKMILAQIQLFAINLDRDNPVDEVRNISLLVTPKQAAILLTAEQKGPVKVVVHEERKASD